MYFLSKYFFAAKRQAHHPHSLITIDIKRGARWRALCLPFATQRFARAADAMPRTAATATIGADANEVLVSGEVNRMIQVEVSGIYERLEKCVLVCFLSITLSAGALSSSLRVDFVSRPSSRPSTPSTFPWCSCWATTRPARARSSTTCSARRSRRQVRAHSYHHRAERVEHLSKQLCRYAAW